MLFSEFFDLVGETKKRRPILFQLDSDAPAGAESIAKAEEKLGVVLPLSYKQFAETFGGGFFGFTKVYSLDENSPAYILRHNTFQSVEERNYVAAIDMGTGDTAGFRVENGLCEDAVWCLDHESGQLEKTAYNDLFSYLAENAF